MCQSAIDWNLQPVVATCMRQLTYIELEVLLAGKAKKVKLMAQHVLHDADSKVWSQAAQVQSAVDAAWSTSKPWILSSAAACFEGGGVPAAIKNFMAIFKDSSIRVTEGRAQAGTSADVAQKVQAALAKMVPGNLVMGLQAEHMKEFPELGKCVATSTFGIAASHVSVGKFELNLMPCLRATYQGSRFATVLLLSSVLKRLGEDSKEPPTMTRVQEYVLKITDAEIEHLKKDEGAMCCTAGPNDVMYLPPGCLVSHRALSQDVAGIRLGVLASSMSADLKMIMSLGNQQGCVQQAMDFIQKLPTPKLEEAGAQEEDEEAKRLASEAEAKRKEEEEKRLASEAEAKRKAKEEEETRLAAEAEAKREEEEEKRLASEAEAKRKAKEEEEAKRLAAEAEAKRKEEEEKRLASEAEAKRKKEEEKRLAAEAEAKRKAKEEEEAKRLAAEAEAKRKAKEEEEKRLAAEAEAKRKAKEEEEKRLAAEAEAKRKAKEEEKRLAAEAQAKRKAKEEEEKRLAAEAQAKRKAKEEEKLLAAEAEAKRKSKGAGSAA